MKRPRSFNFLTLARTVSLIFRPSYYPTVAFAVLLTVTYLSLLPWSFKLWLLAVVYLFTVLIPWVGVMLYRKAHGWSTAELSRRHRRFVPYLLHIVSYLCCFSIIENVHMPAFAGALIVASLMLQCGCIINIWWKISMHSAAAGAAVGALVAYSLLLNYNPVWWLCLLLLLSGCVMSSRMVLLQHTLAQVLAGFAYGIVCGFIGIILS